MDPIVYDSPEQVRRLVESGYDLAAPRYDEWSNLRPSLRCEMIKKAFADVDRAGTVVDLGCGGGLGLRCLEEFSHVIGVDLSTAQLKLAQRRSPRAELIHGDFRKLTFPPASLTAVVCLYALFHVPRNYHAEVLHSISEWLRPSGRLLFNVGGDDNPGGLEPDWLGVPMYWSNFDQATTLRLVEEAGLVVESGVVVKETGETHFWVTGAKY